MPSRAEEAYNDNNTMTRINLGCGYAAAIVVAAIKKKRTDKYNFISLQKYIEEEEAENVDVYVKMQQTQSV